LQLAGGVIGASFNLADADIQALAKARLTGTSRTTITNGILVQAGADNTSRADGKGVTVGLGAVGVMYVNAEIGSTGVDEVYAALEDGARVESTRFINVNATSDSLARATGEAAAGGAVAIGGAVVSTDTDQTTKVRIGNSTLIDAATSIGILSDAVMRQDGKADALTIAGLSGSGAAVDNEATGDALVSFGNSAQLSGLNIVVSAKNTFDKDIFPVSLSSGSVAFGGLSVLASTTDVGTSGNRFEARIDIGSAQLTSKGDNANPGILRIESLTDVEAYDAVEGSSVGGFNMLLGRSDVDVDSSAVVNLAGSTLVNKVGKVDVTTRSLADTRADADVTIASLISGAVGGQTDTTIDTRNQITLTNANIKGGEVNLFAGRDAYGQVNLIDGFANSDVQAYSLLPNIGVPLANVSINETNAITVGGTSKVQALGNATLEAREGLGGDDRGQESGGVLSLSLIPYGMDVSDSPSVSSTNTVNVATGALVEAGINNQTKVLLKPRYINGAEQLPVGRLDTLLTAGEKTALGLSADVEYEYARLNLDVIPFNINTGTVIKAISGAYAAGAAGHYYLWKPVTETSTPIVLEQANFLDTNLWQDLGTTEPQDAPEPYDGAITIYDSNATLLLRQALQDKFYAIKPVDLEAPTFVYKNLGNVLLEQREKVLSWIESHSNNAEAVARYQVQLELIDEALEELGLVTTLNGVPVVKRELDILYLEMPDVYASPGSVFVTADLKQFTEGVNVKARAGANITIDNATPFTMSVNDAIIKDTRRVAIVNGAYTTLTPGNVYFNDSKLTNNANSDTPSISIVQEAANPTTATSFNVSFPLPTYDQDLYIVGDVINETGSVTVNNAEGSITVSGEIRGQTVNITAAKDFTLNSDDWFHTGRDPRQYLNFDVLRGLVYKADGSPDTDVYNSAFDVSDNTQTLQQAINAQGAAILAQGTIAITARFLDINGLIQSGAQNVTLKVDNTFTPNAEGRLIDDNGNPVQGVSFGGERIPIKAYFDATQQAIVVEDLIPEGGRVILAGQIMSTGNGQIKAAYGYANVDIQNTSNYKLIVNRIDTTKDRQGKITLIDTARIVDGAGNDQSKFEYEYLAGAVLEKRYDGDLITTVEGTDSFSKISYTLSQTINHAPGASVSFAPRAGLHYMWTEGQERVQTTVTKYEKSSFNLFGGGTGFEDWLATDNSYKWRTFVFTDGAPLLESEVQALDDSAVTGVDSPDYAEGKAYTISYVRIEDLDVEVLTDTTTVKRVASDASNAIYGAGTGGTVGTVYRWKLANAEIVLPNENYSDTDRWEATTLTTATYESDYVNKDYDVKNWETGGGWLRTKTYHTKITEIEGQKDYYTHTLKADYAIGIGFVGNTGSTINVSSTLDLLVQGDITVANGGAVTLNSTQRSVLGTGLTGVYNDAPDITAGLDAKILVEGGVGVLNVTAGRHIDITAIDDGIDASLTLGQVVSTGGSTRLIADDGLDASNAATSLVQGTRVTLEAKDGSIEGNPGTALRINSDVLNTGLGGLVAKAHGNLNLTETTGDLRLLKPAGLLGGVSVQAGGTVRLATLGGSILDANLELTSLFNTPVKQSVIDLINANQTGSMQITADNFKYPVSPGLYSFLYPHAQFLGVTPPQTANESMNVVGSSVTLLADGGGQVGRSLAPQVISLTGGFAALTSAEKELLSTAGVSDTYGVQHALYRYIGSGEAGTNLQAKNFADTDLWQKITYTATGAVKTAPIVRSIANGGHVLVEFNNGRYGLYQYSGTAGDLDLAAENFGNTSRWQLVTAARSTNDASTADLVNGQLVLNKNVVERVAFQLRDDIDIQTTSRVIAESDGSIALSSTGNLSLDSVRAVGDVYITAGGSISDSAHNTAAAIAAFGNLSLTAGTTIGTDTSPLRTALSTDSRLFASAPGNINIYQESGSFTINGVTKAISSLYVDTVTSNGDVTIKVEQGNMTVESVVAGDDAMLIAQGSVLDAFDDVLAPTVNVTTVGDLTINSGVDTGSASNFFDVLVGGDLSGLAGNDVFINSPADLDITTFTSTAGDITLTVQGETNIGLLKARQGTVKITSQDDIVDRYDDAAVDIEAISVDLESEEGEIGNASNPFDIDTSYGGVLGTVNALALSTVYLIETVGNMRVDLVRSEEDDVTLIAQASMLDANDPLANNVTGRTINLTAEHGDIGEVANALEIDSSNPSKGLLNASALNSSIYITETDGTLYVGTVLAETGDVVLSVRDSNDLDEDLVMEAGSSINALATIGGGDVLLQAGDNVHLMSGSSIASGRHLKVYSGIGDTGNLDATGTTLLAEGSLTSNEIELAGQRQNDTITLRPTAVSGHVRMLGDTDGLAGGDDLLIVDHMTTLNAQRDRLDDGVTGLVRDSVDMDGRGGTDTYTVLTHGSLAAGTHDYIVNVLDSGAKNDGLDTLNIDGSVGADVFLLRRVEALTEGLSAPVSDNTPAFVALLHGSLSDVRAQTRSDVERINYDENINARLIVRSFGGDDFFAVDDNATLTTLDAGAGNDEIQIGQMYGAERISLDTVAAGDDFATVETTAGFLSRGASFALTGYGGTGDDQFTVYSNKAETRLEGNDGNDVFVIRAFALVDQDGLSTEGTTQAIGGEGDDTVMYNINAPVDLDGGAGFDKVVVIGTEFDDSFVITDEAVYGAGLNVRYTNMESLDVDGLEGDDHFFIRSTRSGVVTTIIGGKGADTFDVAGDVTEDIVSLELEGRSGVINHTISSDDGAYGNLLAPGIGLNVANAQSGQIIIDQTYGKTVVNEEGETVDEYTIKLAKAPEDGKPVYINVSAARTTQEEEDGSPAGDSVLISADGINFSRYLTLTVTDTSARTIYVKAVDDGRNEGERVYAISHSSQSADASFNHVAIKNVRVTVQDNDKPEVIVTGTGHADLVLEGTATTQITDTYTVQLGKAVTSGTVVVTVATDGQVTVSSDDTRYDATANTITFNSSNWNQAVLMTVTAVDDDVPENTLLSSIQHTATAGYAAAKFDIKVVEQRQRRLF